MNIIEKIALLVVAIIAIVTFIAGLLSGIPKNELLMHPEFSIPFGIALVILIILRIRISNRDND